MMAVQRSDLKALQNEVDRLWAETRLLREKLATSWEQGMVRFSTCSNPSPLYDSGWVLSAVGVHTFTHNLSKLPTLWSLMAADDGSGTDPTPMVQGRSEPGGNLYGYFEQGMSTTQFKVNLEANGYAYNGAKWYVGGTDYIRLLVWAAE